MKLHHIADLLESRGETISLISEEIYKLAEQRVADAAAEQQGHGFDHNAILGEVDHIFGEIKQYLTFKLSNNKF